MGAFLLRRTAHALFVLWIVCTVTFVIVHASPGGPSLLADPKLTQAERDAIAARLGIDRPIVVQYASWLSRVVRADLGTSFLYQTPTTATIGERLPNTLLLSLTALLLGLAIAVPLGVSAAARPGGLVDRAASFTAFTALAVPAFWLGILLILLFAVRWQLLPAGGTVSDSGGGLGDRLRHLLLPALVLAAAGTAELYRYVRAAARTALDQPFVRAARARGLGEPRIRWRHVLRPSLIPVVSLVSLQLPRLIGGAAITETVFSWPGMGRLGIEAALARDYPLVMGVTLCVSAAVVLASLLADLAYGWVDPRVQHR